MGLKVDRYDSDTGVCTLRDEEGRTFMGKCEPAGRTKRQENQKNEEVLFMQTENYENAGEELDQKAHAYADKRGCSYAEAMKAVLAQPENADLARRYSKGESELDRQVRQGAEAFEEFVDGYVTTFNLSRAEAVKRVGRDVPSVRVYAEDPMRSREVTGTTEPSPRGEATSTPMPEGEVRSTALMQIAVLLGGLPKNPDGRIPFDRAARVLQAGYLDLLVKAAGEKLDSLTRTQIDIDGMPGIASENYPQAFAKVLRKYPAVTEIYNGARITAQGLTDLLPHFQFAD